MNAFKAYCLASMLAFCSLTPSIKDADAQSQSTSLVHVLPRAYLETVYLYQTAKGPIWGYIGVEKAAEDADVEFFECITYEPQTVKFRELQRTDGGCPGPDPDRWGEDAVAELIFQSNPKTFLVHPLGNEDLPGLKAKYNIDEKINASEFVDSENKAVGLKDGETAAYILRGAKGNLVFGIRPPSKM